MCETVCMCVSLYAFSFARMSLFLIDCVCVWLAVFVNVKRKRNLLHSKITAIKSNLSRSPRQFSDVLSSLVKFSVRASDSHFLLGVRTRLPWRKSLFMGALNGSNFLQ